MLGRVAVLTDTGGTIHSSTVQSCPYEFSREQFYGDWDQLVTDFGAGASIQVNFRRVAPGQAAIVRRIT